MTDGVWWFFLFWAPAYFSDQYGYTSDSSMGIALIFTLYAIVTVLSMFGGYLPKLFVEQKGMNPYQGRMLAMLIFAFFPMLALFAQPLGQYSAWWPAIIIGFVGAGHQAWSANIFSITGAIVNRQPFGGMKLSAFGGGIKAGGPNYCAQFTYITDKKGSNTDYKKSYAEAWEKEFRHARDWNQCRGEQNVFRYLPVKGGMCLRLFKEIGRAHV